MLLIHKDKLQVVWRDGGTMEVLKLVLDKLKREIVTVISFFLAVFSIILVRPDKSYLSYIDFNTIKTLFLLMLVVGIIREMNIFYILGAKLVELVDNVKMITLIFICLCFFSSMLITNDVALITFVPFTIEVFNMIKKRQYLGSVIIFETIAANVGSSMTPIGNPQNIYLYSLLKIDLVGFIKIMAPYTIITFILLMVCNFIFIKNEKVKLDKNDKKLKMINILKVITGVDYFLLLTFIFLFIFIGNISRIEVINRFIKSILHGREVIISILSSQVISNVPAAILLSKFSTNYKSLLIGVNIGGLGSLIASMASLISYKFYVKTEGSDSKKYILKFSLYNVVFLIILYTVYLVRNIMG